MTNEFMWWLLMSTPSPHNPDTSAIPPPRPLVQRLGAILWPAFLLAGLGSMVLFGLYDPLVLAELLDPPLQISRYAGYAIGFFCLWAMTTASSFLTWLLLRPAARFRADR